MELAKFLADLLEDRFNVGIFGDVAGKNESIGTEGAGEFLNVFLETFALVSEGELCTGFRPGLGDGPGDRAFISDTKDDTEFVIQKSHDSDCVS